MKLRTLASAFCAMLCACAGSGAFAQPSAGPRSSEISQLAELETAEAWAREFLSSEPLIASFEQTGPGEFTATTASGEELRLYLDNLVGRLSSAGASRAEVLADYEAKLRETLATMEEAATPGLESLMPVLRHRDYLANFGNVEPPHRVLAGDVIVMLAFDSPASIQILSDETFGDLGMDKEAAFSRATENLRRFARDLDWDREGALRAAVLDGNYESSVILLDEVIDNLEADMGGPVAFAVPLRSLLVVTRADRPRDVAALRELVAVAVQDPYPVSAEVFVRQEGSWEVLR
jgi:hypothetical protein